MPSAVAAYAERNDLLEVQRILAFIATTLQDDFAKYRTRAQQRNMRQVLRYPIADHTATTIPKSPPLASAYQSANLGRQFLRHDINVPRHRLGTGASLNGFLENAG